MLHGFDPSFLCLGGEQHIKSRAAPTDTYKQTKQKDLTVFTEEYQTQVFEQMDTKWDVFTLEYSSDHSGRLYEKSNKTWADVLLHRPPEIS